MTDQTVTIEEMFDGVVKSHDQSAASAVDELASFLARNSEPNYGFDTISTVIRTRGFNSQVQLR